MSLECTNSLESKHAVISKHPVFYLILIFIKCEAWSILRCSEFLTMARVEYVKDADFFYMLCVSFLRMKNYSNTDLKNMNTFFHFFPVFSELLSKVGQTFFQIMLTISALSNLVLVHVLLLSACARAKLFSVVSNSLRLRGL